MEVKKLVVLSPDGLQVFDGEEYNSMEDAREARTLFCSRFKSQGYYSSNKGRIELKDLEERCVIVPADKMQEEMMKIFRS